MPEPPENWLSVEQVSMLKKISLRTVKEFCTRGETEDEKRLTALRTQGGRWYVKPDDKYEYWITHKDDAGVVYNRLVSLRRALGKLSNISMEDRWKMVERAEERLPVTGFYSGFEPKRYIDQYFLERGLDVSEFTQEEWLERLDKLINRQFYMMERDRDEEITTPDVE